MRQRFLPSKKKRINNKMKVITCLLPILVCAQISGGPCRIDFAGGRKSGMQRQVSVQLEGVAFKAEIVDLPYNYGDTVLIEYEVQNNHGSEVLIFSPEFLYARSLSQGKWDSSNCQIVYDLGGLWHYEPGYNSEAKFVRIAAGDSFKYSFRLIVKRGLQDSTCLIGIDHNWKDTKEVISRMVLFYAAFIPLSDQFHLGKSDTGLDYFKDSLSAIYFEINLRRINVGPLWFRIERL